MSLRWKDEARALDLSVQDLLSAEQTHLERQSALSSRARLEAGVEIHRQSQAESLASQPGYEAEVTVRHRMVVREWTVTIHGRMDGLFMEGERTVVEEIKSTLLAEPELRAMQIPESWLRQVRIYLWMLQAARSGAPVGRLRVVSLIDGAIRQEEVAGAPEAEPGAEVGAEIGSEIQALLEDWIFERERRNAWMAARVRHPMPFAFPSPRPGQEEATAAAAGAVAEGKVLLLEAPTGMGKTAAVLHGALREARLRGLQVVWVTARTTQRWLVTKTLRETERQAAGLPGPGVRAVTLMAKEQLCLQPVVDCRPDSCRYACYYHLKRRAADAIDRVPSLPETADLLALGEETELCPHALAVDRSAVVDVIVGDYNHLFDAEARLRDLELDRCVIVVDEAHQLPDRAMEAASPALLQSMGLAVLAQYTAPDAQVFREIALQIVEEIEAAPLLAVSDPGAARGDDQEIQVELNPRRWRRLADRMDEVGLEHLRFGASPLPGEQLVAPEQDAWVALARAVQRFVRRLEQMGEETVALAGALPPQGLGAGGERWLRLWCRDPAPILGPIFAEAAAAICMSATLAPIPFFRDRCGLPPDRVIALGLGSVFPPENRLVVTVPGVSTTWSSREKELPKIAEIVQRCVLAVPGNVAVYTPGFQQLNDIHERLALPGRVILRQTPGMDEAARRRMVEGLGAPGEGVPTVLMAVMGGIFAEGVDMPGRLSAVLIVSPALPVPGLGRTLQQEWYEARYGDGFFHAFVQPGMTRVVQAAGRVIRGPEERGAVVLICRRFQQHAYRALLPDHWEVQKSARPWELLQTFFHPV